MTLRFTRVRLPKRSASTAEAARSAASAAGSGAVPANATFLVTSSSDSAFAWRTELMKYVQPWNLYLSSPNAISVAWRNIFSLSALPSTDVTPASAMRTMP